MLVLSSYTPKRKGGCKRIKVKHQTDVTQVTFLTMNSNFNVFVIIRKNSSKGCIEPSKTGMS